MAGCSQFCIERFRSISLALNLSLWLSPNDFGLATAICMQLAAKLARYKSARGGRPINKLLKASDCRLRLSVSWWGDQSRILWVFLDSNRWPAAVRLHSIWDRAVHKPHVSRVRCYRDCVPVGWYIKTLHMPKILHRKKDLSCLYFIQKMCTSKFHNLCNWIPILKWDTSMNLLLNSLIFFI